MASLIVKNGTPSLTYELVGDIVMIGRAPLNDIVIDNPVVSAQHAMLLKVGDTYWLRVPLGKLHYDRSVPLHPLLVGLINDYRTWRGPTATGPSCGASEANAVLQEMAKSVCSG